MNRPKQFHINKILSLKICHYRIFSIKVIEINCVKFALLKSDPQTTILFNVQSTIGNIQIWIDNELAIFPMSACTSDSMAGQYRRLAATWPCYGHGGQSCSQLRMLQAIHRAIAREMCHAMAEKIWTVLLPMT